MKLYATVNSERATKGQGGNKHLNIDIYIDSEINPKYRMNINKRDNNSTDVCLVDLEKSFPNQVLFEETIKGEKQKAEKCRWCNYGKPDEFGFCHNCKQSQ